MRGTRVLIGMAALLFSGSAAVHAQGQEQDPSARVARTSFLQGDVSFRPGTVDDWASATLNYPLTSGDHLWTDVGARAELHVGSNAVRLGPQTALEILDLDDNHLQLRLTQGSALIRLRTLDSDDNVEIDTPTGAVTLMRDGIYRVDVSADGATSTVTARNGDAEVTSNDQTISVRSDETVLFTADGASNYVRNAPPMDEYDQWADARDRAEDQSVSAQYVTRDMTGYEDLDRNGSWSDDPEYGHVWAPSYVAVDWAPYRYGRWVWVEPYGWTWIDDAPWGFAPFHYGRWAYTRNHWVWAPGVVRRRPVYAPALVVFVGGNNYRGSRWDGRRDVAWFPLAPNEVYRPAYRASDRYVRRVNVTNINVTNINITNVNVTNIQYRNQRVNGAVTAVPQDQFAGSRRIGRGATIVPVNEARNAHVVGAGAPVAPTQQSVLIRRQGSTPVSRPSEAAQNRQVVWKNTPPPRPATFASHADQFKTTGDTPVAPLPISQTRGAPRSTVTGPMSHTDGPATTVTPYTNVRRVPNTRPNVNVQRYPAEQAQPDGNVSSRTAPSTTQTPNVRSAPSEQPNVNVRPAPAQPNVNVRPAPSTQPNMSDRSAPSPRPNPNDRPMSHTDGPSTVNGSQNDGPAHTVQPNTNVRAVPSAQPAQAPREAPRVQSIERPVSRPDVQPSQRPAQQAPPRSAPPEAQRSPAPSARPQPAAAPAPPRTEAAAPPRRQADDRPKQEQRDKSPRHG
ncbi:MAG: putative prolin-rich exported protein [Gemmatimonadetes bacterium]|nr:putative prolin-rich exported protein [Gemmatimonadota bacterium]